MERTHENLILVRDIENNVPDFRVFYSERYPPYIGNVENCVCVVT